VDRNNLGKQTLKEFQNYRPPGTGRSFTELYNAQRLGPAGLDPASKVVISTIQRLYSQLTGAEIDETAEERSEFETAHATARLPLGRIHQPRNLHRRCGQGGDGGLPAEE